MLAGLRPLLRARNYLAYTAAMTPLIIVLLDAGATPGIGVLIDRLVATLIGAGLVIATNWLFGKFLEAVRQLAAAVRPRDSGDPGPIALSWKLPLRFPLARE